MYYRPEDIKPGWIVGYSTIEHLCLDLDNTTLTKAHKLVKLIMREWPEVGDCLIAFSGGGGKDGIFTTWWEPFKFTQCRRLYNFHAVFDNKLSWNKITKITRTLAACGVLERDYEKIRKWRGDLTIRVSAKCSRISPKPPPEPVLYICNPYAKEHHGYIDRYLAFREAVIAALSLPPASPAFPLSPCIAPSTS
jgi:hypothetical protein